VTRIHGSRTALIVLLVLFQSPSRAELPPGIEVRLVSPNPSVCLGSSAVDLEALITNNSGGVAEITPDGIRYGLELKKTDKSGKEDEHHIVRDIEPDNWEILKPHQTVIVPFKESISGTFFADAGIYQIQIRYGAYERTAKGVQFTRAIKSNVVIFEMKTCGNTRK
jgi:hypothetical protein